MNKIFTIYAIQCKPKGRVYAFLNSSGANLIKTKGNRKFIEREEFDKALKTHEF